jgi:hypothetical protein
MDGMTASLILLAVGCTAMFVGSVAWTPRDDNTLPRLALISGAVLALPAFGRLVLAAVLN